MKIKSLLILFVFITNYSNSQSWNSGCVDGIRGGGHPKTFSASIGYGTNYGGRGVQAAVYFTPKKKVGISVGAGDYFGDIFVNAGVKFYLWKTLYLNPHYGYFKRIYFYEYDEFSEVVEHKHKVLGPGFFMGYDWFLKHNMGINIGGGINYDNQYLKKIYPGIDIGVFLSF